MNLQAEKSTQIDLLKHNFLQFEHLVQKSEAFYMQRAYVAAATQAEIAAFFAMSHHTGLFSSNRLERLLEQLGRQVARSNQRKISFHKTVEDVKTVLHVLTKAGGVGGDTRLVWRWIQQDSSRQHSLILTRQGAAAVPPTLKNSVSMSKGRIWSLNDRPGHILTWANTFRKIAQRFDTVILHTHPYDIIPVISLAEKTNLPPLLYVDHADQVAWVGAGVVDFLVSLRRSGQKLAQERRGFLKERTALLPTILGEFPHNLSKEEAKATLGLSPNTVAILTVARPHKYRSAEGINFAETHLPILKKHPDAVLLVVGPEYTSEWESVSNLVENRINVFGKREDTALFYQAADIYVDSHPINSITSLLEAGMYGLPVISRCEFGEGCEVLCADAPGLDRVMIRSKSIEEYQQKLSQLVLDKPYRQFLGKATHDAVDRQHRGEAWQATLENIYQESKSIVRRNPADLAVDKPRFDEIDFDVSNIQMNEPELDEIIEYHLRLMPLGMRVKMWKSLNSQYRQVRLGLLLPEWVGAYLERIVLPIREI